MKTLTSGNRRRCVIEGGKKFEEAERPLIAPDLRELRSKYNIGYPPTTALATLVSRKWKKSNKRRRVQDQARARVLRDAPQRTIKQSPLRPQNRIYPQADAAGLGR